MDAQLKRLVLCAAFSPYSALLGRILREHAPDDTPLDRFRSFGTSAAVFSRTPGSGRNSGTTTRISTTRI